MTGWHYTTWNCWSKIKTEGLKPYPITKKEWKSVIGAETVQAIWMWRHRFTGKSHFGSIIYQMSMKNEDIVVLLEVDYEEGEIMGISPEQRYSITHSGTLNKYTYHDGTEKSWLLCNPIPPERIRLIRIYDLPSFVDDYDKVLAKKEDTDGFRFHCSGRNVITRDRGSVKEPRQVKASETLSRSR